VPPPAAAAAKAAIDAALAGMQGALTRYQEAYAARNMDALLRIFPTMPREDVQPTQRQFNPRNCRTFAVDILSPKFSTDADAASGTVEASTSYICQPPTAQKPIVVTTTSVFVLRKAGTTWVINRILTEGQRTR
jgi:hypothetical protein